MEAVQAGAKAFRFLEEREHLEELEWALARRSAPFLPSHVSRPEDFNVLSETRVQIGRHQEKDDRQRQEAASRSKSTNHVGSQRRQNRCPKGSKRWLPTDILRRVLHDSANDSEARVVA